MSTSEWRYWHKRFIDSVSADLTGHLSADPITALELTRLVRRDAEPWHYWAVCGWLDEQVRKRRVWVMRHAWRLVYCTAARGEELEAAGRITQPIERPSLSAVITHIGLDELGLRREFARR